MLDGKRILFYIPEGNIETNGLYISQVLGLIRYCVSIGAQCMVFQTLEGARSDTYELEPGIRVVSDRNHYDYVPFVFQSRLYRNMARRFYNELEAFKPTHIYTRQYLSCRAARELADRTGAKLIMSRRGAEVAERLLGGRIKDKVAALYMRWAVARAVKCCDHISTVAHFWADRTKEDFACEASVLPCCVQDYAFDPKPAEWIAERRKEMGFPVDAKVVCYSGGVSAWQRIDEVMALLVSLYRLDPSIRFLVLSRDIDAIRDKCQDSGLPQDVVYTRSCQHREVSDYLQVADCGVILRADTVVNRAASPIKIGEYLAAGLGVVVQPWIGDAGRLLTGKAFACQYTEAADVNAVLSFVHGLSAETKIAARNFARRHYSYAGNNDAVLQMFA